MRHYLYVYTLTNAARMCVIGGERNSPCTTEKGAENKHRTTFTRMNQAYFEPLAKLISTPKKAIIS